MSLATLLARLEKAAAEAPKTIGRRFRDVDAKFLEERAKANTPYRTGKLRNSVRAVVTEGKEKVDIELTAGGPDVDYAVAVHEDVNRPRPPHAADTPEGGEGAKFLSRTRQFHQNRVRTALQEEIRGLLSGKRPLRK